MVNNLSKAKSAFLREAAEQPIIWREWSPQVLEEAKREDKPILIDVGAVWCHWCHVMDRETYSNEGVAMLVNEDFIPVKVDRDEMPDLDRELQNAVFAISGETGWPLTVFMTPSGKVFFGGTYFPPDDMYGRIGFKRLLKNIAEVWKNKRDEIERSAFDPSTISFGGENLELSDAIIQIVGEYDLEYGGLGNSSKFPHPLVDTLMLNYSAISGDDVGKKVSLFTAKKMYNGAIFDQVGGGYHRYTVDREWKIPHFEKLLIDNAEIMLSLVKLYEATNDVDVRDALERTYDFVKREMDMGETFANSLDADSDGIEGYYYTWTLEEMERCLAEDFDLGKKIFGISKSEEVEGRKILLRDLENEKLIQIMGKDKALSKLNSIREKLLECRKERNPPFKDINDYTHPNARMSEAMLYTSTLLGNSYDLPLKILRKVRSSPHRRITGNEEPSLEDMASVALADISAFEISSEREFLDYARDISSAIREKIRSSKPYPLDSPNESSASLISRLIAKMSILEGADLKTEEVKFAGSPSFYAGLIDTNFILQNGALSHVVIVDEGDSLADQLQRTALLSFYPLKVVERVSDSERDHLPSYVRAMFDVKRGSSRAFVCIGKSCSQPVTDQASIKHLLKTKL
ncbi:thioredoxin domain-containing protein [Sulfuracidifex metallicus]|uniref:thioredoxin domain-containing protein n=1 Tax=Sulfuracidifex metallicus TaxID=47303 RepID=UPI0022764107|nr:thioredoxin domain-containing protein [Sulfuracidifex metallicus]MCY0849378.1 thioredoxin domain-containing protein [Sulfuracidifex metallicus]